MTESEAKRYGEDYLNDLVCAVCKVEDKHKDFVRMSIKAFEKQIAKKPIMKPYFDDMEEEYLCCPTCGEILTDRIPFDNKDFYFHCLNCGQKFDYGE